MPGLPDDLAREVRRTIGDLRRVQLAATAWPAVAGDLARLAAAIERDDVEAVRAALVPISQATFEGKVRGRLAAADQPAALVVGTKPTSALPIVGRRQRADPDRDRLPARRVGRRRPAPRCSPLFIFGVALAGTQTTKDRLDQRRAKGLAPTMEPTERAAHRRHRCHRPDRARLGEPGSGS